MYRRIVLVALVVPLLVAGACARPPKPTSAPVRLPPFDVSALQQAFETEGLTVAPSDNATEDVFSGLAQSQPLIVGGRPLQVYWFPASRDASVATSMVRKDGYALRVGSGFVPVEWDGMPHFFARDRLLVLYLSRPTTTTATDSQILGVLNRQMGRQFAGTN